MKFNSIQVLNSNCDCSSYSFICSLRHCNIMAKLNLTVFGKYKYHLCIVLEAQKELIIFLPLEFVQEKQVD